MSQVNLIEKYNIPVPRYTSYPTVPFWENTPTEDEWFEMVKETFNTTNSTDGISLYIHLPFCESLCTYCACNTRITVNHAVEKPYIESLLKEWQLYINQFDQKPIIRELHLGGGTPTFFSAENLKWLIESILSNCIVSDKKDFSFEAHPANTSIEHLKVLSDLGFDRISFGIQDFDLKVQDAINRYQTFEEVEAIVNLARNNGYKSINFDLVYGLPFQNLDSIKSTIEAVIKLIPDRIAFYSYAHVPWIKPGQRKFTEKDLPQDSIKRELYEYGKIEFLKYGYYEVGMDHFSLSSDDLYLSSRNNSLHRNFMGYTPFHTKLLIGLGASSISDCWNGFIQNIKTVEEYQKGISLGHLSIIKGHTLNEEDLVLRKHILNIMCSGYTSWKNEDEKSDELFFVLERLKPLEKDGLIILNETHLQVTENGKPFLRNICSCFDARYWAKTPEAKIFSSAV
ncbi:MAG: oxygen-independent coproporphyrinogen III oxidase [Bacteroidia bacterium]